MNLKTKTMNEIIKCKCGGSSIELEPVSEDCFNVNTKNVTLYDNNGETTFVCGGCENDLKSGIDTTMIEEIIPIESLEDIKGNKDIVIQEDRKFKKVMPKGTGNILAKYDRKFIKGRDIPKQRLRYITFIGSDKDYDYYIKKQIVNVSYENIVFDNFGDLKSELALIFKEQLALHAETSSSFADRAGETCSRTRPAKWCVEMPLEAFYVAMNILGVKVKIFGK